MSDIFDTIVGRFPPEVQQQVRLMWQQLPPDVREELRFSLTHLERLFKKDPAALSVAVPLLQKLVGPALGPVADVAILGPVNVGKSSLYNALVPAAMTRAEVTPIPGTTRKVQTADLGVMRVMDTPGAENWADVKAEELDRALAAARDADFLLIVFDASRGILPADVELHRKLAALGKRNLVVLNKIDLIEARHRSSVVRAAATALGLFPEHVVPVSAARREGIDKLVLEVAVAEPRLLAFLGRMLPALRRKLSWQAIRRATVASVAVALTPLPLLDLVPLTGIQVSMMLTLARLHGEGMTVGRAFEILATFGAGVAARSLFQELVKVGGLPGWVLSASVAGTTTLIMGVSAMQWFGTGKKLSKADAGRLTRVVQERLAGLLRGLGRRGQARRTLTQHLHEEGTKLLEDLEQDVDGVLDQGYGAIFDMDGVLVDSGEAHYQSWAALGQEVGRPFTRDLFARTFGMHNNQIIPLWWEKDVPQPDLDRMAARKEALYRDMAPRMCKPLPGVKALIERLFGEGFRLAVASSGPAENVRLVLQILDVADRFSALVTGDDVQHGKPDPEVFLKAARALRLDPRRCVVVEDAPQGVEAGRKAGSAVVALTSSRSEEALKQAQMVVSSLEEVNPQIMRRLIDAL